MDGVWIKKVVTPEQYNKIKEAEFVELRLVTTDGSVGEAITLYPKEYIKKQLNVTL